MRRTATALIVLSLALYAPMNLVAQEACCMDKPYPGLGPPDEPTCYEGVKIYDNDGQILGCVGFEGGNCIFCEAVIHVGGTL